MRISSLLLTAVLPVFLLFTSCRDSVHVISYDRKVDSIIQLMTLDEKIGQLSLYTSGWDITGPVMSENYREYIRQGRVGALFNAYTVDYVRDLQRIAVEETRLGIPLIFGYDVIHGHRTIFPVPLAQACSWDLAAIEHSERIAAVEATAEGINWVFAPMVDISRDPRWGRVMEGAGEDTWLGSMIASARVRGFQGSDIAGINTVMACVKHFAAYGAPLAGRDYNTVDMSERSLYEWYLPPYKAAADAGVGSVMTSFNEIAGIPSSSNRWLLTELLRDKWSFNGFVVSDYTSINELIPHGVAADEAEAGKLAFEAGLDMDMQGDIYNTQLKKAVVEGKITGRSVDDAVKRILEAKYRLGLFDDPYRYCDKKREAEEIMTPEHLSFARQFAASSMVLLKNDGDVLPVNKDVKTIAVIGPLADSKSDMLGPWSAAGLSDNCVTLLEGMKSNVPEGVTILYARGCDVESADMSGFGEAMTAAQKADFVVLALGEGVYMSGEAASRTDLSLPGIQMELAQKIISAGKPTVAVLFNGRPLLLEQLDAIAPAILEAWYGGTQSGNAVADILLGKINPSARLTMTFPRNTGQIPLYYNHKNTGRPVDPDNPDDKWKSRYIDSPNTPLYPFGYGLSYTTFRYSDIMLNRTLFGEKDEIEASVIITNTGDMEGYEIVQLYIHDMVGDVTRPVKELKGFSKVFLEKGETKKVTFTLTLNDLAYFHSDMSYTWDPGEFELFIGPSSADTRNVLFSVE